MLLAVVVGLAGAAPASRRSPGRPPHQRQANEMYGCDRTFGRQPEGHLVKRTNPAAGQRVQPGGSIVVTITWDTADWSADQLHKVLDCVAIDGELVPSMQDGESPTANDGRFTSVYRVPGDAPDGAQICDQAMLSGPSPRADYDRQISNQVCHTVESGGNACGQPSSCDRRGERAPCERGCAQPAPPPCHDGCAERPSPPPCGDGCAERPPCNDCRRDSCGDNGSCDGDRAGRDRHDRRGGDGKDCDCDGRRRHGLVGRLIEKLV